MRIAVVWLPLTLSAIFLQAQDPGMIASQQAMLASQQATLDAQQANEQATRNAQQAMQNAQSVHTFGYTCPNTAKPAFSVKPGAYSSTLKVKIHDATRGAVIYYTTDGWTPTADSTRYNGSIAIDSSTRLQAIAIAPGATRSRVATAVYILNGVPAAPAQAVPAIISSPVASTDATGKVVFPRGMVAPLVFAADLNSKTADVGDKVALTLSEDIKAGDTILVRKGAAAVGTVTESDKSHGFGVPGEIIFRLESLQADGTVIQLRGTAAREGQGKYGTAAALMLPIGPWGLLEHGEEAQIKSGTPFTAYVDADTVLAPK